MIDITEDDLEIMALTVWAEARGEFLTGQSAVAWVIKNRWKNPGWWSRPHHTIRDVCLCPYQFSCWNRNDPNRNRLINPATKQLESYKSIRALCSDVIKSDEADDPSKGSDHYCTKQIAPYTSWAKNRKPTVVIGNHQFYRIGLQGNNHVVD